MQCLPVVVVFVFFCHKNDDFYDNDEHDEHDNGSLAIL